MDNETVLYSYWRSTAAYRVRIALQWKRMAHQLRPVHLVRDGGQQHAAAYHQLNPQELVPTLVHGDVIVRQSLAIIAYLDEICPDPPLLPRAPSARARVRSLADVVACDIHPIGNLRVLQYLEHTLEVDRPARQTWSRHWIEKGFQAIEAMLAEDRARGDFCHGDTPGLADICLIPQVYNARRFGVDMQAFPVITAIDAACREIEAFRQAAPEAQPDAG